MKLLSGARKREEQDSREPYPYLSRLSQASAIVADALVNNADRLIARRPLTLTDLDLDARVPPLRPLLPEWRNWQTQGT